MKRIGYNRKTSSTTSTRGLREHGFTCSYRPFVNSKTRYKCDQQEKIKEVVMEI